MKALFVVLFVFTLSGCFFTSKGDVKRDEAGKISSWDVSGSGDVPELKKEETK